jgi:hypothetical protein
MKTQSYLKKEKTEITRHLPISTSILSVVFIVAVICGILLSPKCNGAEERVLRIIAFGAHPDDYELKVGGTAVLWTPSIKGRVKRTFPIFCKIKITNLKPQRKYG